MKASITDVVKTLLEAILLVFLVMYLFLQNFRATLIPTIAVPVVLMGTFAVLYACGYSINTLTMFAMVLAIGLLVDDAIVVVENRRAHHERGGPVATRGDPQIDGTNSGRAGGDRDGAVGGIRADGLLRRHHRRHLSPVLNHYRRGDGPLGAGGHDPHPLPFAPRCLSLLSQVNPMKEKASSAGSTAPSTAAPAATKPSSAKYCTARCAGC